jgi:acyl-CoA reductase-like NAD-dependent aldehyde dehydrogenase
MLILKMLLLGKMPFIILSYSERCLLLIKYSRTVNGILARSGQICVAASRLYIQESIANTFINQYKERMRAASDDLGDPQDPAVSLGPLADTASFEKVKAIVSRAKQDAELIVGGLQHGENGCYMQPTVFLNPKPNAEILREEVFGPVSVILTFKTEDEVIKLANDTEFGLMAGVFTKDITRALRVSSKVESGVVGINCISAVSPHAD